MMMKTEDQGKQTKFNVRDFLRLGEVGNYFLRLFGKKDPGKPKSINLSLMHGINRISVLVFLAALLFFIGRKLLF